MSSHLEFFGLASEPFGSAGERSLVLETGPVRRAVAWARSELAGGESLLCVRGAKGVGKSSLAAALPHVLDQRVVLISRPMSSWKEIEAAIIEQLELDAVFLCPPALLSVPGSAPAPPVIVVNRAETLSRERFERFEGLRWLDGHEGSPLVAVLFLADEKRLTGQLRQVVASCTLAPLQPREIRRYLEARMLNAGFEGDEVFPPATCSAIYDATGGIPSGVDLLCTTLMVEAARRGDRTVQPDLVAWSCGDADMPALKVDAGQRPVTPGANATSSSEAAPHRDPDVAEQGAPEPEPPAARHGLARNEKRVELPEAPDLSTAPDGVGLQNPEETETVEDGPAASTPDTEPAQEQALSARAPWQGLAAHWRARSRWASFAALSTGFGLVTAVVGISVLPTGERGTPVPATPDEPRIAAPSPSQEATRNAALTAATQPAVAPHVEATAAEPGAPSEAVEVVKASERSGAAIGTEPATGHSDASASAVAGAGATEPSELGAAAIASDTQESAIAPSRRIAASAPHEPVRGESGPYPAARARDEPSASVPEPTERQAAEVAGSTPRPAAATARTLVWPQSVLDAQRRPAPRPGRRDRLEIPEPELASPARRGH